MTETDKFIMWYIYIYQLINPVYKILKTIKRVKCKILAGRGICKRYYWQIVCSFQYYGQKTNSYKF